jgi:alanyl-tRNA synthetase
MKNHQYIIADHSRAACMMINDGVMPSGKQRGYILRRLLRRMLSSSLALKIDITDPNYYTDLTNAVVGIYDGVYEIPVDTQKTIITLFQAEASKYNKAIATGQKEWTKILANSKMNPEELAKKSFDMYQSLGVPLELSEDILDQNLTPMNLEHLATLIEGHQQLSASTSQGQFKSGLGENTTRTTAMHTTTHILHQALRDIYGEGVRQMGSAITDEKARFDFSCDKDVNNDIEKIQNQVRGVIKSNLIMTKSEVSQAKAKEMGAIGLFGEKYGDIVTVYQLHDKLNHNYSIEFCGGPHISNTSEIAGFTILKVKSLGQGIKRIEFDVV